MALRGPNEGTIADPTFRRMVLVMRWLLLAAYIFFTYIQVLDITPRALFISAAIIFVYNIFHVVLEFRFDGGQNRATVLLFTRCMDVITISTAMLALHDPRNPVWAVYFINIVSIAHMISRREMILHVLWVNLNYLGVAAGSGLMGYAVSWPYVITVSVLLQFMGFNAGILAGGEERLRRVMAEAAATDSLTGLPNRHCFHENYGQLIDAAITNRLPLSLMLLDVDHFKQINDVFGHPVGDDKLRDVAAALQAAVRRDDIVARYGGDEFIVVAPRTTRDEALHLAERLREAAASCSTSLSIGVAVFPEDAQREDALIEAADTALYRAKQAGRNCVRGALAA